MNQIEMIAKSALKKVKVANSQLAQITSQVTALSDTVSTLGGDMLGVKFSLASSSPAGTRLYAAVGKTVTPGVGVKGTSDFDQFPVYNLRLCNRVGGVITAYEGEPGFSTTAADVFVEIPRGYYRRYVDATDEYYIISDKPFVGSKLHKLFNKRGKVQDFVYIAAYKSSYDGSSKHETKSGKLPDVSVSRTTSRTRSRARGTFASIQDVHARDWLNMLMMVEFASKNIQAVLGKGYSELPYADAHVATVAETSVNRIILANAHADLFVVGQECSCGTARGNTSIFADRTITAIEVYDASNKAITVDGAAFTTVVGRILWSSRQKTGKTDAIGSGTGRAIGTDGKTSVRYRGIEDPYGNVWEWVDNLNIRNNRGYSDPLGRIDLYSDTDFGTNYVAHKANFPATNNYVKRVMLDETIGVSCLPEDVSGGSSSTYFADYYYQAAGDRAACVGGGWDSGAIVGPWSWYLSSAASSADIRIGARLMEIQE